MDARPFSLGPSLTLAVRATPFSLLTRPRRVTLSQSQVLLALDCSMPFAIPTTMRLLPQPNSVHSLWLGNPWLRASTVDQSSPHAQLVADTTPRFVVFDLAGTDPFAHGTRGIIQHINLVRSRLGRDDDLLLRIRPGWLAGGRRHLADLTALRHIAEEWDFGFALDLSQKFDPSWEAEAAVMRLGNRLQLLRLVTAATGRLAVREDRVAARALATALDLTRPPSLALVPSVPVVMRPSPQAQADAFDRAVIAIAHDHQRKRTAIAQYLSRGRGSNPNIRN